MSSHERTLKLVTNQGLLAQLELVELNLPNLK
jgi:hypothetical protein